MRASVFLANSAKVSDGMVDALGVGWNYTGPGPAPFFVAGVATCDWHELNQPHELKVELLDADGAPVPHPENGEPIFAAVQWEMGRPPGTKQGSSLNFPFAIPFAPFQLEPGQQYVIAVSFDGDGRDEWRLPFTVRPAPPS